MTTCSRARSLTRGMATGVGVAVAAYATYALVAWLGYGHPSRSKSEDEDPLLDRFMPMYDVAERHHMHVNAPADITLTTACETDLLQSTLLTRAIFRARELMLGSKPDGTVRPRGLLAAMKSLGWGVLAEEPGREVIMGAVTRPWEANVTFRALPPDAFAAFNEPGFVKIAWTLRADPVAPVRSVFRTETRAVATDQTAREKFRRYWSFLSAGIIAIRWLSLQPVKAEAERRMRLEEPRVRQIAAHRIRDRRLSKGGRDVC